MFIRKIKEKSNLLIIFEEIYKTNMNIITKFYKIFYKNSKSYIVEHI